MYRISESIFGKPFLPTCFITRFIQKSHTILTLELYIRPHTLPTLGLGLGLGLGL